MNQRLTPDCSWFFILIVVQKVGLWYTERGVLECHLASWVIFYLIKTCSFYWLPTHESPTLGTLIDHQPHLQPRSMCHEQGCCSDTV
ncbi:hypothetical protein Hgul01_01096 [Herpetosiphon gulosus]|uniref:Uncharacterized protein n=1 Tax=Herpetosiphon gulosus TaxID=1973496 RepID=A0ABP9WVS5_9CHLR